MYKIIELCKSSKFIKTGTEPMYDSDIGETVQTVTIKDYSKLRYPNYLKAVTVLDNIKKKGVFMIVKEN